MESENDSGAQNDPYPSRDETVRKGEDRIAQHHGDIVRSATFRHGQVVGERYRIIRLIATGGMGEVYEAEDLDLSERVALKTLKAASYPSLLTLSRFRREIRLARRVTHPNVCRVHDAFTHVVRAPDGREIDELACVTMELLEGETLAEKLEREGRLSLEESLSIVRQMAEALAAAHDAGIIHRDFKPGNVVLVRQADGGARAVVTDFGLARKVESDIDPTLTETGMVVGTPAYMSPEQLEGRFITTAADIYALGVVIYQMVTGERPFPATTPISLAVQRLNTLPVSPAVRREGLDRTWEATILRCLEPHPDARFGSARDVVAALEKKRVAKGKGPRRNRTLLRRRIEKTLVLALFVVALIAGVGGIRSLFKSRGDVPSTTEMLSETVEARRAAAVFGLKNLSGSSESAWLSTALAEMLRTEMAAGEQIRLISGEDIARAKVELGLSESDAFSEETLTRLRANLGAALVVVGSYIVAPAEGQARLSVDVRLQDTQTGETVLAVERSGAASDLLSLVANLGSEIRVRLGTGVLTASQNRAIAASKPANNEALRLYSEGLDALRGYDALAARELLEHAIDLDAQFSLAHVALADAWATLGYDAKSADEARIAQELSGELDREMKLLIEGRFHESTRNWEQAIATYETLFRFYPDNLEYGLRLASAETSAGDGVSAAETIASLRALPEPLSSDPRIDLAEAAAAEFRGDFRLELSAADKAIEGAKRSEARLLEAAGLVRRGLALRELSELEQAAVSITEAVGRYQDAGDRGSAARATYVLATIRDTEGRFEEAERLYNEAITVAREIGWKALETQGLNSLTTTLHAQGRLQEAVGYLETALHLAESIGNKRYIAARHINLGHIAYLRGELDEAERELTLANQILRDIGDEYSTRVVSMLRAFVGFQRGELEFARRNAEETREFFEQEANPRLQAYSEELLGKLLYYQGHREEARRHLETASALRSKAREAFTKGRSDLALAIIDLDEGKWEEAAGIARRTSAAFRDQGAKDYLFESQLVLAAAEAELGNDDSARRALGEGERIASRSENPISRLAARGRSTRVRFVLGEPFSLGELDAAIAECTARGLDVLALDLKAIRSLVTTGEDHVPEAAKAGIERLPLLP